MYFYLLKLYVYRPMSFVNSLQYQISVSISHCGRQPNCTFHFLGLNFSGLSPPLWWTMKSQLLCFRYSTFLPVSRNSKYQSWFYMCKNCAVCQWYQIGNKNWSMVILLRVLIVYSATVLLCSHQFENSENRHCLAQ